MGYKLTLYEKTGFRNINGNPIVILDCRNKIFYDSRRVNNRVWEFNLPEGVYTVEAGKISKRVNPVEFNKLPLPKPERYKRDNPEHFEIVFTDNPNKCTVDWTSKQIIYDNQFKQSELPIITFIYFHEIGHRFYKTEQYCDNYAYNRMLDAGYNPSQIAIPFVEILSDRAINRKFNLVTNVLKDHFDFYDCEPESDTLEKKDVERFFIGANKFTYSGASHNVWNEPGGKILLRSVKAGDTIGKVESLNNAGTWGYLRKDQYNPKGGAIYLGDRLYTMLLNTEAPKGVADAIGREIPNAIKYVSEPILDFLKSAGVFKLLVVVLALFLIFNSVLSKSLSYGTI